MEPGGTAWPGGIPPCGPRRLVLSIAPPLKLVPPPPKKRKAKDGGVQLSRRRGGRGFVAVVWGAYTYIYIYIYYKVRPLQRAARAGREQEGQEGERGEEGGVSSLKEKSFCAPAFLCIAMHPSEQAAHAVVAHEDGEEGKKGVGKEDAPVCKRGQQAMVQQRGVYQQGDEGPCLLWVPAPIAPPGDIFPNGPRENAGHEQQNGGGEQCPCEAKRILALRAPTAQCGSAEQGGAEQEGVCCHD